ncbi:TIGR00303 family protein [Halobacteriales archaeon QS_9_68_17]|nr:MAG: TIGR00303 family protein [Halobacteriales archaeon QS_9_68_17]
MRLVLAAGTTRTASIPGISAAGADPEAMVHTPSADAEIVAYGAPVRAPVVPVSPSGCPTPAVVTRAVRDLVGFDLTTVGAGLAENTAAPTVTLFVGETIPGGTTTALGVLTALGEDVGVSSSLPDDPVEQKREVVADALDASDLDPGDLAGDPRYAVRYAGDPMLATVAGLTVGALRSDTPVTLAGGTQMVAAAALVRHADVSAPLSLATTSFVAGDEGVDLDGAAERFDLDLTVTDPGFDESDHVAMERYVAGEAKEGVGMGGALALADRAGVPMAEVRERVATVHDDLLGDDAPTGGR